MIFQHTIDKVLSSEKTQTRRLVKPGECLRSIEHFLGGYKPLMVMHNNRPKWQIGHTYAVQPARGKPASARIQILDIWREDVRMMSESDLDAEGFRGSMLFPAQNEFLAVWCAMHDPAFIKRFPVSNWFWVGIDKSIHERPYERYTAWALKFKLA